MMMMMDKHCFEQELNHAANMDRKESIEENLLEVSDDGDEDDNDNANDDDEHRPEETKLDDNESHKVIDDNQDTNDMSAYPDTQVTYSMEPSMSTMNKPMKVQPQRQLSAKSQQNENQPLKRGQRSRLKKMKEKYKDQDEEDRQVRMQLLGSAGNEAKKKQQEEKLKEKQKANSKTPKKKNEPVPVRPVSAAKASAVVADDDDDGEQQEDEEEKAKRLSEDARLLSTLTGQPTQDDPLINVIGVCAPWSTLHNYKYKVKILPGGLGKKGKSNMRVYMSLDCLSVENILDIIVHFVFFVRCSSSIETLCYG
jgi:hypothetical protein